MNYGIREVSSIKLINKITGETVFEGEVSNFKHDSIDIKPLTVKEIEIYVLWHKVANEYIDPEGYLTRKIEKADKFNTEEEAEECRLMCDDPEEFIIKKLKIVYEIQ
jgi:hypothetical protein